MQCEAHLCLFWAFVLGGFRVGLSTDLNPESVERERERERERKRERERESEEGSEEGSFRMLVGLRFWGP